MENNLELVIKNPSEEKGGFLKKIEWNKEEFINLVTEVADRYDGLVYTDEDIPTAKKDRATLNALKKAISDRRISVKKEIMEPYEKFNEEVNEVVKLLEKPAFLIDSQIKEYEQKKKDDKKQVLFDYFVEKSTEKKVDEILKFENVFEESFLNASFSISRAKKFIDDDIAKVRNELDELEQLDSEFKQYALDIYRRTMDMSKALLEVNRLQAIKKREEEERKLEEQRQREEEERKRNEEISKNTVVNNVDNDVEEIGSNTEENEVIVEETYADDDNDEENDASQSSYTEDLNESQPNNPPKLYTATFKVYGSKEQILDLKAYMIKNNIQFGK